MHLMPFNFTILLFPAGISLVSATLLFQRKLQLGISEQISCERRELSRKHSGSVKELHGQKPKFISDCFLWFEQGVICVPLQPDIWAQYMCIGLLPSLQGHCIQTCNSERKLTTVLG